MYRTGHWQGILERQQASGLLGFGTVGLWQFLTQPPLPQVNLSGAVTVRTGSWRFARNTQPQTANRTNIYSAEPHRSNFTSKSCRKWRKKNGTKKANIKWSKAQTHSSQQKGRTGSEQWQCSEFIKSHSMIVCTLVVCATEEGLLSSWLMTDNSQIDCTHVIYCLRRPVKVDICSCIQIYSKNLHSHW